MQKISPFLWFDHRAEEAARFYVSVFRDSRILGVRRYGEAGPGKKGEVMTLTFELEGGTFMALNGGPSFSHTPAVSFFVTVGTPEEVDAVWDPLSDGGQVLMELGEYPFSRRFGWLNDRYGVSWQVGCMEGPRGISPYLLFTGDNSGRAEEAARHWASIFPGSTVDSVTPMGPAASPGGAAPALCRFRLAGVPIMAFDGGQGHSFTFSEALSFFVWCRTQEEVDRLWAALSEGGRTDMCGWLKDRYGVSWQVVPEVLGTLLDDPDPARVNRVMKVMLGMTKLDIRALEAAGRG